MHRNRHADDIYDHRLGRCSGYPMSEFAGLVTYVVPLAYKFFQLPHIRPSLRLLLCDSL